MRKVASSIVRRFQVNMLRKMAGAYPGSMPNVPRVPQSNYVPPVQPLTPPQQQQPQQQQQENPEQRRLRFLQNARKQMQNNIGRWRSAKPQQAQ